jgi:hypothetical protein
MYMKSQSAAHEIIMVKKVQKIIINITIGITGINRMIGNQMIDY